LAVIDVLLPLLAIVVANILIIAIYASRYKRVPPNRALVVYGARYAPAGTREVEFKVYTGGGRWIRPIIEAYEFLSLEPFLVERDVQAVIADVLGTFTPVYHVKVRATARVPDDLDLLEVAARNLLHQPTEELQRIVGETLEGHIRGIVASYPWGMPDAEVARQAQDRAAADLRRIGIEFVGEVFVEQVDPMRTPTSGAPPRIVEDLAALKRRVLRIEEKMGLGD